MHNITLTRASQANKDDAIGNNISNDNKPTDHKPHRGQIIKLHFHAILYVKHEYIGKFSSRD